MSADLTREQIEAWREWFTHGKEAGIWAGSAGQLCDMALRGLANESAIRPNIDPLLVEKTEAWIRSLDAEAMFEQYQPRREIFENRAKCLRAILAAAPAEAKLPEHLIPHQELAMVAKILSEQPFAKWRADDAKAILGFVNLHIGYHTGQLSAPPEVGTNSPTPRCDDFFGADDYRGAREFSRQLERENASLNKDAGRYRWLRDKSVPPHQFYISVPIEFKDDKFTPQDVDAAIDAARGA
jgi:hypothetical protein